MRTPSIDQLAANSALRTTLGDASLVQLLAYTEALEVQEGTFVIRPSDGDRSTYFVFEGRVRLTRPNLPHVYLRSGDAFGALCGAMMAEAHVVAVEQCLLARLTDAAWRRLREEAPALALNALELLALKDDPARVAAAGLPKSDEVYVRMGEARLPIIGGTPADELLPTRVDGQLVVAALLDRKAVSLSTPITVSCELEPLTTTALDGQRFFRQSQALLLLEAAHQANPALRARLSHSLGFAQRVDVDLPDGATPAEVAQQIDERMRLLVEEDVPLREEWCSVVEAREILKARGWENAADQLAVRRSARVKLVAYGDLFVPSPGPLLPSTGLIGEARVIADDDVLLLVYGREGGRPLAGTPAEGLGNILDPENEATGRFAAVTFFRNTREPVHEQHRWLQAVGIESVGEFNQACIDGDVGHIIRVSEGFQEKRIGAIADQIAARRGELKVVTIAGPSSSGKSTFIRRLTVQLQVNGLSPIGLSLDDYYCDREHTPRDAGGEFDFESILALQLDLLNDHLGKLTAGEAVQTPRFDFHNGHSERSGGPRIRLGPNDVLLLEGIHGLNPSVLRSVSRDAAFRIFICPLTQLPFDPMTRVHVSDVRLLRRLVRDRHGRSTSAIETIKRWPSVREGERLNIFPYQEFADTVFDSSLIYELAVLKVYAERYLLEVPIGHASYTTAQRLLYLISQFVAIYPDHVPPTSLLREFIGGSSFER